MHTDGGHVNGRPSCHWALFHWAPIHRSKSLIAIAFPQYDPLARIRRRNRSSDQGADIMSGVHGDASTRSIPAQQEDQMGLEPQPLPPEMPGPGDDIPTPEEPVPTEPVPTVPEPPQAGPWQAGTIA
jgi:hypothetical protein